MQRHHHLHLRRPFPPIPPRRPGLPPFGRVGLLGDLLIGGVGYLIGRRQGQSQYQQRSPRATTQSDQLARLQVLGQLRESGVLTEEEFQQQKQKILQQS
jgi:hypothetical protein